MTWPPKVPFDKWQNLYREKDGRPRLRRSVVAFLDLLGYRSAVERAHAEGQQHEFLLKLRTALDQSLSRLRDIVPGHQAPWRVKAFTDNIVLCFPMLSGEDEAGTLPIATDRLGSFQLYMTIDGFFIRGGVAVADAYWMKRSSLGRDCWKRTRPSHSERVTPALYLQTLVSNILQSCPVARCSKMLTGSSL